GKIERGGDLIVRHTDEVMHFDDAGGQRIIDGQLLQGLVQGDQTIVGIWRGDFADVDLLSVASSLQAVPCPGTINQDAAHCLCRCAKEMSATVKLLIADKTHIGFMDECRGVQRLRDRFVL
ncbi:MAG: hypothetical protein WCH39_30230, partial [Schlesneria sp.]